MASSSFNDPFQGERKESTSSSGSEYLRPNAFAGHRDTLARLPGIDSIAEDFDDSNYTFSNRSSLVSTDADRPALHQIPAEVLHIIFDVLEPADFDAARHACRQWYHASLDTGVLRTKLKAAHCYHAFLRDQEDIRRSSFAGGDGLISEAWLMSKRLSTTIRLSWEWRGRHSGFPPESRLAQIEEVNFRRIMRSQAPDNKVFTTSTCGKYVLLMCMRDVYVYRITTHCLEPIIRLAADREVFKVSMDTTSGRYAVAGLLDNRTGVLWDLSESDIIGTSTLHSGKPMTLGMQTEVHGPQSGDASALSTALPLRRPHVEDEPAPLTRSQTEPTTWRSYLFGGPIDLCITPENEDDDAVSQSRMAIQNKPTAVYRNIGSSDDKPRSVAICPSRKCAAFGCRLGIELHWVDALTGGDLNRWFPLVAPSDHLYFLPQRAVDSSKKLRLISSAAAPVPQNISHYSMRGNTLPPKFKQRAATHDRGRRQSMTRLFFGNIPFPSAAILPDSWRLGQDQDDRQGVLRTVDCDHYYAVPLSNGLHLLYTDPTTGLLCLGSDAPLGGPTKLIRKLVFTPPSSTIPDNDSPLMSCYTAGHDLERGVSVVAAHRDGRLILYHVPSDIFDLVRNVRSPADIWDEHAGVLAQSDLLMDNVIAQAHANTSTDPAGGNGAAQENTDSPRQTVHVRGVVLAYVEQNMVDDLAVSTANGGLRIWSFCSNGYARCWDLYGEDEKIRYVKEDGVMYEVKDFGDDEVVGKGKERAK